MLGVRLLLRGVPCNLVLAIRMPFQATILAAHFCRQLAPILGPAVILKGRRAHTIGNHKEQRGLETPVYDYGLQGVHCYNIGFLTSFLLTPVPTSHTLHCERVGCTNAAVFREIVS